MKLKKFIIIFCYLLFVIWFSGCAYISIAFNNFGDAIFKSTKKIDNKIKNPIKENVRLSVLWAGHSTMLVQMYDKAIIFDPYFNNHLGGLFLRRIETGLDIDYLNQLDLICVSHSHMDHLCFLLLGNLPKSFQMQSLFSLMGLKNICQDLMWIWLE